MDDSTWHLIISIGTILWAIVSGLLLYIWRQAQKRIEKLENNKVSLANDLIHNPVLTLANHADLCEKNTSSFNQRIDSLEKNLILTIENAILKAVSFEGKHDPKKSKKSCG